MTLDLNLVAAQIVAMADGVEENRRDWEARLKNAIGAIHKYGSDPAALRAKIENSKTSFLAAGVVDNVDAVYPAPPCPADFCVVASDGSHIDVDRHRPLRCSLINIGEVLLQYGSSPKAHLGSRPTLYTRREELELIDPLGVHRQDVEGPVMAAKRMALEVAALLPLAQESTLPRLALLDGSLILWGLAGKSTPDFVKKALIDDDVLKSLQALKDTNRVAVASYVSFPRSSDVVDALRIACCPFHPVNCDRNCVGKLFPDRPCDSVGGIVDRDIFSALLQPGERSALFASRSKIVRERYGAHEVYFFYMMAGEEIARVEIPRWVAEDKDLLDLTHALILNQARRGHGYPLALTEAHEKAVLTGADRELFWRAVDRVLATKGLSSGTSGKSASKRTRWV